MLFRLKKFWQKAFWAGYSRYWASKMTALSMWRYFAGIVDRMRMGMTVAQASERSLRVEHEYIGKIRDRILAAVEADKKKAKHSVL
jgi:hypothetical protein